MYRVSLVINRSDNREPGKPLRANRMLALVACAEFLGMTLWFSATAAGPAIASEFQMAHSTSAWLTMAVQAGFVVGTLLSSLMNLADVLNPRRLVAAGCLVGAVANASIVYASTPTTIIVLRFLTGMALACVYPPGMKIVAGWFGNRRGTALGIMVGALTLGSAFPHLLASDAQAVAWRTLMWISSGLALAGGALIWLTVSDGPYVSATAPFDPRAVLDVVRNRGVRLSTLAYLGHMWELYAMWTWISTFATAPFVDERARTGSLVAFTTIASGAAGCVVAGIWADDFGKARVARLALMTSAACCACAGLFFRAPTPVLLIFAIVWGFSIVADSAQFSALVSQYSTRTHVGTSLTLQTAVGFLLTMASIRLLPWVASIIGWQWTFLVLVPGPVLGAVAMSRLMNRSALIADPESLIPESSNR